MAKSNYAFGIADYKVITNDIGDGGYIFIAPSRLIDSPAAAGAIHGNEDVQQSDHELEIRRPNGEIVSYHKIPANLMPGNFQLAHYKGKPVFTWWEGKNQFGHGFGNYYVSDLKYNILKKISLPTSQGGDIHEFRFLSDHIVAVTGYNKIKLNNKNILEGVFSIINLDSGKIIFNWHSSKYVPISESVAKRPLIGSSAYDYFHINSVTLTPDGNYLISARNTNALYKINSHTGDILWQLGGKNSSFTIDPDAQFAFQHDAQFTSLNTIILFDNHNDSLIGLHNSSVLWIHIDESNHQVSLVNRWYYPKHLSAWAMGNTQVLANGSVFGSWGTTGHIVGFNAQGELIYDAKLSHYRSTYRAFYYPNLH